MQAARLFFNRFRMREYVKRGSVSYRRQYAHLREAVWNEVYSMDKEGIVLHDHDIQFIAMREASKLNLHEFKVSSCIEFNNKKVNFNHYFFLFQASDGWVYYFKKKYNIVSRHIDKVTITKPSIDKENLDKLIETFKLEQIPIIQKYDAEKV